MAQVGKLARRAVALCFALGTGLGVVHSARAQPTVEAVNDDPTLELLIQQSLAASPELARARSVVRAQQETIPQAESMPDPMLQLGLQNDGFTSFEVGRMPTSYVSVMASQTFPWPGKLALRKRLSELSATESQQVTERVRLATQANVRRGYLNLLLVRDRMALLDRLETVWQASLGAARARYESGVGSQSDVLRAQLQLSRLQLRRVALAEQERAALQAINRLRDHPLTEPIPTTTRIPDLATLAGAERGFSESRALDRSPELAAAKLNVARAQQVVDLADKDAYPDLTVGAGIMIRGALPPMWQLTVAAPLPIFYGNKQGRAVAEGRAWADAAEAQTATVEQLLCLRTQERRSSFAAVIQTLKVYDQGLLLQSQAAADSTLSQYRAGQVDFSAVLDANAAFIADQEAYLQTITAAHQLLIAQAELSLEPSGMATSADRGGSAMGGAASSSMGSSNGASPSGSSTGTGSMPGVSADPINGGSNSNAGM